LLPEKLNIQGSPALFIVSPILVWKDKDVYIPGTAVLVARNLAITARHVIEGIYKKYFDIEPKDLYANELNDIVLNVAVTQLETGAAWYIRHVWSSNHTDIAFLALEFKNESAERFNWHKLGMDLRLPSVGTKITAIGFRKSKIIGVDEGLSQAGITSVKANCEINIVNGQVQEVHGSGRDKKLKFSCFRTNAKFDPQMSGGPVLDGNGFLRGLVCTGYDLPEGAEPISYVAGIMPALAILIDQSLPDFKPVKPYPALNLARDGFIIALGHECVTLTPLSNGVSRIELR
jgi:hypothetical protein